MLRLERRGGGGFYSIELDGTRLLRGVQWLTADELQLKFIDAMGARGSLVLLALSR